MSRTSTRRRWLRDHLAMAGAIALSPVLLSRSAPVPAEQATAAVRLRELYEKDGSFSALAQSLAGKRVPVRGFMAPPLKADAAFFVLTKRPMSTCPFCESAAEWPRDILVVRTKRRFDVLAFNIGIVVDGVLELGTETDPGTGFVSRVRLTDAIVERV